MSLLAKLFKKEEPRDALVTVDNPAEGVPLERNINYQEIPHALDLGWYYSENKDQFQMAKIAEKDRGTHFYIIGASGTGKTKFLEFLIKQDIENGNGFGVIDPHGDLIEDIKGFLAIANEGHSDKENLSEKVILIAPTDPHFTVTLNPLEKIPGISIPEQAQELVSAFRKIWSDSWGVRMEDLMRNSLIALGEAGLTLAELPPFLTKRAFRESILEKVSHPIARDYFQRFETLTDRGQITWIEPVMNKINAFLANERIGQIFSSSQSSFNLREVMDHKKILLVKLDKGKLKDTADLLGSLIMAKLQMAAFSRSDIPPDKRVPFYLYIDEFQNFASESFAVVLSEARKYGLSLIMAHQTLAQISTELRSLILGNTGIQIYFRINRQDAELLAKEGFGYSGYEVKTMSGFHPNFWSYAEEWEHKIAELQNLPPRVCYAKHKIEGGIIPLRTVDIEPPWEVLGMREGEYRQFLKELPLGKKYLMSREDLKALAQQRYALLKGKTELKLIEPAKPGLRDAEQPAPKERLPRLEARPVREELSYSYEEKRFLEYVSKHPGQFVTRIYKALQLSGYKGDKIKEELIEKGLLKQEETRYGEKGRLAKVLTLTAKGEKVLSAFQPGKGGDLHKQLQGMVKEQAELLGWKAKIEERIEGSSESVDVGLEKDELMVAVEISVTTDVQDEIQNLQKCIQAGYDYIICAVADEKTLHGLKTKGRRIFSLDQRRKIRYCAPSEVKSILQELLAPIDSSIISANTRVFSPVRNQKQLLSVKEAAQTLGVSIMTLYSWVSQRKIPYVKVGRLTKFKVEDLKTWLERRRKEEAKDFI